MPRLQLAPAFTHTQRHLPNAVLAQTMKFLVQPLAALAEALRAEVAANPALEIVDDGIPRCPRCRTPLVGGQCPRCSRPVAADPAEPIVFVSPPEDHAAPLPWRGEDAPDPEEVALAQTVDLPTYVARQISPDLPDPADRRVAAFLLANLNDDGLLNLSVTEAAYALRVSPARVEAVLVVVETADPPGVGAPSPREALLAQARLLAAEGEAVPPAVFAVLEHPRALETWAAEGGAALAALLGLAADAVAPAMAYIARNLNPYPARAAWGSRRLGLTPPPPPTAMPDVVISFHNHDPRGPLVVEVLAPLQGLLRVNPLFRETARRMGEAGEALQEQVERAALVVKSLRQRENTMLQLMRLLTREQRGFIVHGDEHLKPMTRARMAERLGVSESTMSRAVAGKLVQLPNGKVIPLARFFDTSLPVRAVLRRLVASESRPQSDAELARRLKALGFPVARRTVAKYRAIEHIPSAHQRRAKGQGASW